MYLTGTHFLTALNLLFFLSEAAQKLINVTTYLPLAHDATVSES